MLMSAPSGGDTFVGKSGFSYTAASLAQLEIGGGDVRRALQRSWTPIAVAVANQVAASRVLTVADNGQTLECTNTGLTLTVPIGLGANFGCAIIPKGTTSIASDGTALLNGATTTVTRADTANSLVAIVERASTIDSYVVSGS